MYKNLKILSAELHEAKKNSVSLQAHGPSGEVGD